MCPPLAVNGKSPGRRSESIVSVGGIDLAVHGLQSHTGTAAEGAQNQSQGLFSFFFVITS